MRRPVSGTAAIALVAAATAAAAQTGVPSGTALARVAFTYPPQAGRLPALKAWLARQEAPFRAGVEGQARADAKAAAAQGRPFLPHESDRRWKVVTDTPRFLSLSVERYDFTGGAHGMTTFGTTIWDKADATARTPLSFFTGAAALDAAIRPAFCRRLDAERARKRRGDGVATLPEFTRCIDPLKETPILGSATGRRFDRIGILVQPYDAGPYAEGGYDVTVPVTPAILAVVKPEWRRYFAVAGAP